MPKTFDGDKDKGMVVGTISIKMEKPIYSMYNLYYKGGSIKKISGEKRIRIEPESIYKLILRPDFMDGDKAVFFFSITEPPGEYAFEVCQLIVSGAYKISYLNIPIKLHFAIEPGRVEYIGEVYINLNEQSIELADFSERDLAKFAVKFPGLKIDRDASLPLEPVFEEEEEEQ